MVDLESRKSFSFFISYWEAIEELPEKEQLPVLKAIIKYAFFDEEPTHFKGIKRAVFLLVKPTLDKSKQKASNGKQKGSKRKANESKRETNEKQDLVLPSIGKGEGIGVGKGEGIGEGEGDILPRSDGSLFTVFWNAYPESARRRREDAWNAWKRLNPDEAESARIMEYLEAWKLSQRWTDDDGGFIPNAENFLDPDRGYMRNKPAPAKQTNIWTNNSERKLDQYEIEAIHRVLNENFDDLPPLEEEQEV